MVRDRVVQRGREHPSRKSRKAALDFQGQIARSNAVRLSPEIIPRGEPSSLSDAGAAPGNSLLVHSACLVTPGSKNMANDHEGFPGTWEALPSPSKGRPETRLTNSRTIRGPVSRADGDERGARRWYRQAKATKCGERDVRESQYPIVAPKRGNGPSRTPWSEGGAASWTGSRNHAEGIEPPRVSPRGGRIV